MKKGCRVEETGQRKDLYAKTEKEAWEKLQQALQEQRQGILATGPQQKLKDYLEYWFENVQKHDVRKTTYMKQYRLLHKHIIPTLGHIQLQKLTPLQVQKLYTGLLNKGMKPGSVKNIHKVLRKALQHAVKWKLVSRNVCNDISLPSEKEHEAQTLTLEQAKTLLATARGHKLGELVTLALLTGMRHGELAALRRADIDLEKRSLHVRHSVSYIRSIMDPVTGECKIKGGYIEGEPKSATSKREILLPDFVVEMLRTYRIRQKGARQKVGELWQDLDLVFCNRRGGFLNPDYLLLRFYKLLDEVGLARKRLHDLRHSIASILGLEMKAPDKLVQELLGHSHLDMTWRYTHSDKTMHRRMMDGLNDLFGGNL